MTELIHKSIKCDCCNQELIVDSCYPAKYSIELKCINTGINTGCMTYAVSIAPPIKGVKHFCDIRCLGKWANEAI